MKRYNVIGGAILCFLSSTIFADANGLFDNSATPQSYRQQGQSSPVPAAPNSSSPSQNQAQPPSQPQTQAPAPSVSPTVNVPSKPAMVKNAQPSSPVSLQELQSQFSQLNQVMLMLQQQSDRKMEDLYNKNNALQAEIGKLQTALILLNQEVEQQNQQIQTLKNIISPPEQAKKGRLAALFSSWFTVIEKKWNTELRYGVYLFVLILMAAVVLTLVFMQKKRKKKLNQEETISVPEDEYDFMGSKEGIPAKLNLAQAYLAMEDFEAAEKVIREIIDSGDPQYQEQALNLLDKIPINQ